MPDMGGMGGGMGGDGGFGGIGTYPQLPYPHPLLPPQNCPFGPLPTDFSKLGAGGADGMPDMGGMDFSKMGAGAGGDDDEAGDDDDDDEMPGLEEDEGKDAAAASNKAEEVEAGKGKAKIQEVS